MGYGRNQRDVVDHHNLSTGLPMTVSFCYTLTEIGAADEIWLRSFRWNSSDWEKFTGSVEVDTEHHCVTAQGVSNFSPWTLFDTSGTPKKPTAARVIALAARGFAPVGALLALGGAAIVFRRQRYCHGYRDEPGTSRHQLAPHHLHHEPGHS